MKNYKIATLFFAISAFFIFSIEGIAKPVQFLQKKIGQKDLQKITVQLTKMARKTEDVDSRQEIFTGRVINKSSIGNRIKGFFVLQPGEDPAKDSEIKALKLTNWSKKQLIKEKSLFIYCVNEKALAQNSFFEMSTKDLERKNTKTSNTDETVETKTYAVKFGIMIIVPNSQPIIIPAEETRSYKIDIPSLELSGS